LFYANVAGPISGASINPAKNTAAQSQGMWLLLPDGYLGVG